MKEFTLSELGVFLGVVGDIVASVLDIGHKAGLMPYIKPGGALVYGSTTAR